MRLYRDIPPLPLSCNAYTLDEITLLLRFSLSSTAYLWKKKNWRNLPLAVGETGVDDEMIPTILELWSMSGLSPRIDAREYTGYSREGRLWFRGIIITASIFSIGKDLAEMRCKNVRGLLRDDWSIFDVSWLFLIQLISRVSESPVYTRAHINVTSKWSLRRIPKDSTSIPMLLVQRGRSVNSEVGGRHR